jgi:HSP20 family protein
MNLWETDQALLVEVEVPGIAESDLDVEVTGKDVTIRGRRQALKAKDAVYHRRERQVGEFERTFQVPIDIDGDQVEAKLVDGVLSVTLPKAAVAKPRKIAVHVGS